jgi:hypothetical protein
VLLTKAEGEKVNMERMKALDLKEMEKSQEKGRTVVLSCWLTSAPVRPFP